MLICTEQEERSEPQNSRFMNNGPEGLLTFIHRSMGMGDDFMKNSLRRFFSIMVALVMILSNLPLSLAEELLEETVPAEETAPVVSEQAGELTEEQAGEPSESPADSAAPEETVSAEPEGVTSVEPEAETPAEPDASAATEESAAPEEQAVVEEAPAEGAPAEEVPEAPAEEISAEEPPVASAEEAPVEEVPEAPVEEASTEGTPAGEVTEAPASVPAGTEEETANPVAPETEVIESAAEEAPAEEKTEVTEAVPAETTEESSNTEVPETDAAETVNEEVPATEGTEVSAEEEPDSPEAIPVDATLRVGGSWRGTFDGTREDFLLRLTVNGWQAVRLTTDGLPVSVRLSSESDGSSRTFACKYDDEAQAWTSISADFELAEGSYLIKVTPVQAGSTGAVSLSVIPQPAAEEETPAEEEAPAQEEAPAEEATPAESEAIAENETPVEEDTSAEEKTPVKDETPAEGEAPAEDETPVEEEASVEEETPAEEEAPAEGETPAENETSAEEGVPVEGETPAEEAPAEEGTPIEDEAPAEEEVHVEEEAPAEEALAEEETSVEGESPVEDVIPVEDETSVEDGASAAGVPAEEEMPIEDRNTDESVIPAEDEIPVEDETPAEESAPVEDAVPDEPETPAEDTYPAVVLTQTMPDGTVITVNAPEGALPNGVQMRAVKVLSVDLLAEVIVRDFGFEYQAAIRAAQEIIAEGQADVLMRAYDVSFYLPAQPSDTIEPAVPVDVQFQYANFNVENGEHINVYHVDDGNGSLEQKRIQVENSTDDLQINFSADQFSTYIASKSVATGTSSGSGNTDLAPFVSVKAPVKRNATNPSVTAQDGWYNGVITAEIPLSAMMGYAYDQYLSGKALAAFFGKHAESWYLSQTYNKIPLTVTFPGQVVIDEAGASITTNSTNIFRAFPAPVVSGNTITFTPTIVYNMFGRIFETYYLNQKDSSFVYVKIPYSVYVAGGSGYASAPKITITGSGRLEAEASSLVNFTVSIKKISLPEFTEGYGAWYQFVSNTEGKELPDSVMALLPNDPKGYSEGDRVKTIIPEELKVTADGGFWLFDGYTPKSATFTEDDITFTGGWSFNDSEPLYLHYDFMTSYEGDSYVEAEYLPDECYELLDDVRRTAAGRYAFAGDAATPVVPDKTTVTTDDGTWTFRGYMLQTENPDPEGEILTSVQMENEDVNLIGIWDFEPTMYKVQFNYTFTNTTDHTDVVEPYDTVQYSEALYRNGQTLTANKAPFTKPAMAPVYGNDGGYIGNWTAANYTPTSVKINGDISNDGSRVGAVFSSKVTYAKQVYTWALRHVTVDGSLAVNSTVAGVFNKYFTLPAKTFYYGDTFTVPELTPSTATYNDLAQYNGVWTYDHMDTPTIEVGTDTPTTTNVNVYWRFEPYMHDVVVTHTSATSGWTISPSVLEQMNEEIYEPLQRSRYYFDETSQTWKSANYKLTSYYPAYKAIKYTDKTGNNDGTWTYNTGETTYTVGNLKTADAAITVTYKWTYTAAAHSFSTRFIDQDGNNVSSNSILKTYLPKTVDKKNYRNTYTITPLKAMPGEGVAVDNRDLDRSWYFDGWYVYQKDENGYDVVDENGQKILEPAPENLLCTMGRENFVITGKWHYVPYDHQVIYSYISGTANVSLPAGLAEEIPVPVDETIYHKGDVVTVVRPAVEVYDPGTGNYIWTLNRAGTYIYRTTSNADLKTPVTFTNTITLNFNTYANNSSIRARFFWTRVARGAHKVIWNNENGTELNYLYYALNAAPSYKTKPTKAADEEYRYVFAGWKKEGSELAVTNWSTFPKVTAADPDPIVYTAVFTPVRQYTVTFVYDDGTELQSGRVDEGTTPAYTGTAPAHASDDPMIVYEFQGWKKDGDETIYGTETNPLPAVDGDVTYTAAFERKVPSFDVRFLDEDGTTVLQEGKVQYGDRPVFTGELPEKTQTEQYTTTFTGWKKDGDEILYGTEEHPLPVVEGNVTYKATYTQELRSYTIRWYDGDGQLLATDSVEYGETPSYNSNENPVPTKAKTNTTVYTFSGSWNPEITKVSGDANYTALFTETARTYTVTWMDEDGSTVLNSKSVSYAEFTNSNLANTSGTKPAKAEDARAVYTFDHFELTVNLEDSKTFTAVYRETIKQYKVTYVFQQNSEDTIQMTLPKAVADLKPADTSLDYGTKLTLDAPVTGASVDDIHGKWRFEGWNMTDEGEQTVTGEVTFTGTWTYAANGLDVNYRFVSTEETWTLPETITALCPATAVGSDGTTFVLAVPEQTSADETQDNVKIGTWTFLGWKLSATDETYTQQVTLDGTVINATGYWAFTPADMPVTYTFAPAEGSPDFTGDSNYSADQTALAGKLPEAGTAPYGSKAQPAEIAEADKTVNGTYGKWTFQGWMVKDADENLMAVPDGGQTVTTSGVAFIGQWAYTHDTHTVGYLYLSNDGSALPDEVTAKAAELTQVSAQPYGSDTEAPAKTGDVNGGTVVKVLQPDTLTTRVNVNDGTWVMIENSWKLAASANVTDASTLQDIPEEGVRVTGDIRFAAQWRFVPNSEKQVTLTLHDGIDETHNKVVALNPADETLMNLPEHPFGSTVDKDGRTYHFIGWRGESALFGEDSAIYLYSDGAAFRFSNPGILLAPDDNTADNTGARLMGWLLSRAYADEESFSLRGDLYAVWLIESPAVTARMDLKGDLLVNGDTEHTAVPAVKPGDTVTISAELNAAPVKEQIQSIYKSYDDPRPTELNKAAITLKDVRSTFTVKVHSVGVDLSENTVEKLNSKLDWTTDDVNGATFAVTGLEKAEGTEGDWVITISLQNAERLTTFDDLYTLIHDNMKNVLAIAADGTVTQAGGYARVTGTVDGTFYGLATLANTDAQGNVTGYHAIPFSFVWEGKQDPEKSDKLNPKPISVTMQVKPEITLPGDLAVAIHGGKTFDTEHDAIFGTRPGASLDFNASLKVKAIKEQMLAVESGYGERASDFEAITFADGVKCIFNVELNVQNGLTLPKDRNAYTLDDQNFAIDSVTVKGNTAGIRISFKTRCNTYADLHEAIINNTADVLNLKVSGVQVGNNAGAASMTGGVSGEFAATAVLNTQQIPFAFTWKGTQDKDPDGSDFVLGGNPEGVIQLTVQITPEVELPGDLLVARNGETEYDTEHKAFFAIEQDAPMDYLASLKVGKVFQQMQNLVEQYSERKPELESQLSQIEILEKDGKRIDCAFTAVFIAQHGLSLAKVDPNSVVLKNPGKFSITDTLLNTTGNNHTLTVTMTYAPNGVTNFLELYNDIEAMASAEVQLLIPGITAEIPAGTLYLQGTVGGSFAATARYNNSVIPFAFEWKGTQDKDPDGSDFALGTNSRGVIQLTVQVVPVVKLPGDIQMRHNGQTAFTTEHDQVYTAKPGDKLDYAAVLDVSSIKQLITDIGNYYASRGADEQDQIRLSNLSCTFDVSVNAQPGLDLSRATFALPDSGSFSLTVVSRNATQARLKCTFNPAGMDTFDKLLENITGMPDLLVLNVNNVGLPKSTEIPMTLTLSGTVSGLFHGDATYGGRTIPFDFRWNGVQEHNMQWTAPAGNAGLAVSGDGQDAILGAAPVDTIQASVVVTPVVALPGDLQVKTPDKGDTFTTEHEQAYTTKAGAGLTYAATLDVSAIKGQLHNIRNAYSRIQDTDAIALEDLACGFTVTLTADSGLDISKAVFALANTESFRITDSKTEGQTATLTLNYVTDPRDFATLFADIDRLPDMLLLTAAGVEVKVSAGPAVMTGTVDGSFYAMAEYNGTRIPFAFVWSGEQDHNLTATGAEGTETGKNGADALLPEDTKTIQLTVVAAPEVELPGDLQVKTPAKGDTFTTEHENVYVTEPGASLTYAALLNVTQVKEQLLGVQNLYEEKADAQGRELPLRSILLSGLKSRFTVTLTADNGLTLPTDTSAYLLKNGRKFRVTSVSAVGQTATITIDYNYQPANFLQLKDDIAAMDDLLELDITGVQAADAALPRPLAMKGEVNGEFYAVATLNSHVIPFAFTWKGTQDHQLSAGKVPSGLELNKDGQDAILGGEESEKIQLTVVAAPEVELPGDLQVKTPAKGDAFTTEHERVYVTEADTKLTYAATLNVTRIKEQLLKIQETYDAQAAAQGSSLPLESIALSGLRSRFVVTLTADDGLTLPTAANDYTLINGGCFAVTEAAVNGQTAVITIDYQGQAANFAALKTEITELPDLLELDVAGVNVPPASVPTPLTMKGKVTGDFYAMATLNSHAIPFAFIWKGTQDHELKADKAPGGLELNRDGQDAILGDEKSEKIQLTVVVAPEVELPGDLQVREKEETFTTEHERVFITHSGASLTYAATLNVAHIKAQLLGEEAFYGGRAEAQGRDLPLADISLSDLTSSFTVVLTADEGLTLPTDTDAYTLVNGGSFEVTGVVVDGQTTTITIDYKGTAANFQELKTDITGMADLLELNITGVKVPVTDIPQILTMKGGVSGNFYALATLQNHTIPFAFDWKGTQDHKLNAENPPAGLEVKKDGQDAILGSAERPEIQLTVLAAPEVELPGDLQVKTPDKGDAFTTEHERVYITEPGASLTYAATLNVARIKTQLLGEEMYYTDEAEAQGKVLALEEILLSELESKFVVTLTADPGLTLPTGIQNYQLKNGGSFEVTKAETNGQTAVITIEYKAQPATFLALKQDITAMDDLLELDVTQVTVPDTALPLSLTMSGEVNGDFFAVATLNSHVVPFAFDWKGTQDHELDVTKAPTGLELKTDGQDAILGETMNEKIQLTVAIAPEVELPGDLQVHNPAAGDALTTEHTEVYKTYEGTELDYAATLNVKRVFNQMMGNEVDQAESHGLTLEELQKRFGSISLKDMKSTFTITLTADEGLTLPGSLSSYELVNAHKGLFTVTGAAVEGQTATLTITYDKDSTVTNYAQLAKDIQQNVDELLQLNIHGVKVAEKVTEQYLTIRGKVTGEFYALATARDTTMAFVFRWAGIQDHEVIAGNYGNDTGEGLDYIIDYDIEDGAKAEDSDIWVTVEVITDVRVIKVWEDKDNQDGKRPESLTVALNGEEITLTAADAAENNPNQWSRTVTGLPKFAAEKEIVYTWTETEQPEGYRLSSATVDAESRTTTIINVHEPERVNVTVEKIWEDNNNQDGIRPGTVKLNLLDDGKTVASANVAATEGDRWTYTFTGMDKYAGGQEIAYTVLEDEVPDGYTAAYSGLTVTNTHTPETINIPVTKIWDDNNDQDKVRPESVELVLLADGTPAARTEVTAAGAADANTWTVTFENLPKYSAGREIVYTVSEPGDVKGYTKTEKGLTVTNRHEPETVTVTVIKVWDDADNQEGKRPESLEVTLNTGDKVTLTEAGNWTGSVKDLPKYADGKAIAYTWTEEALPLGYQLTGTEVSADGLTTTLTNHYTPETTSLTVEKIWADNNNAAGERPAAVYVTLLSNGTPYEGEDAVRELSEANGWSVTYSDLPVYKDGEVITYSVTERPVENYTAAVTPASVSADNAEKVQITNLFTPGKTTITVTKVWEDGENRDGVRPASIEVNLLANSTVVSTATLTADGNGTWTHSWTVDQADATGTGITYTVEEVMSDTLTGAGYTAAVSGSAGNGFIITNSRTPETVNVTVTKVWEDAEDQDGIRPDFLPVTLSNGTVVRLSEENSWTATVENLPKFAEGEPVDYTWTEPATVEGYQLTGTAISADGLTTTLTNTHEPAVTTISGTKIWADDNDNDGLRPESITVNLLADGETVRTQTVTGNDWTFSFTGLPVYREGRLITYTVDEDAVPEYEKTITGNAAEGFTITNTHAVTTITVSGVKVWNDGNNSDGLRPDSITVNLLANGEPVDRRTVTGAGNTWFYTFTGLNQYMNGERVTYTVTEDPVAGYVSNINGTTITNTHQPTGVRLTVRYFYNNGAVAAPTVVQQHQPGDAYDVVSPVIPNYVASQLRVTGTLPGHDVEYAVIYTPAPNPTPGNPNPTVVIEELETPLGIGNTSLNTGECFE